MNNKKLSFIGSGNMATGIITGIIKSGNYKKEDISVFDISKEKMDILQKELGINTCSSIIDCVKNADYLFICVEPSVVKKVIKEIRTSLKKDTTIISIAAGVTIEKLDKYINGACDFIRVMPNMNIRALEGMCMICKNEEIDNEKMDFVKEIFSSFGECVVLDEKHMNAFIAIAGSSPAYIFVLIEAMADGGVNLGLEREVAYKLATQAVLGSASTVKATNISPATLKDMVCSPGGTTIEAITTLEKCGFRSAMIEAMKNCYEKANLLSK